MDFMLCDERSFDAGYLAAWEETCTDIGAFSRIMLDTLERERIC